MMKKHDNEIDGTGEFISCSAGVDRGTQCVRKKRHTEYNVPARARRRGGEKDAEEDDFGSSYVCTTID